MWGLKPSCLFGHGARRVTVRWARRVRLRMGGCQGCRPWTQRCPTWPMSYLLPGLEPSSCWCSPSLRDLPLLLSAPRHCLTQSPSIKPHPLVMPLEGPGATTICELCQPEQRVRLPPGAMVVFCAFCFTLFQWGCPLGYKQAGGGFQQVQRGQAGGQVTEEAASRGPEGSFKALSSAAPRRPHWDDPTSALGWQVSVWPHWAT